MSVLPGIFQKRFSRRQFLCQLLQWGALGIIHWLIGCTPTESPAQLPSTTPEYSLPTATSTPSPSPEPTETLQPSPTPDIPLFDENQLTPVFVAHDPSVQDYPLAPPFAPDTHYPELPYVPDRLAPSNGAYRLVREALHLMNPEGFDTPDWNPLQHVIFPGDKVLIKPNLVDDSEWRNGQTTHPAFLRPVIDYVYKACGPDGQILLAEGPWSAGIFDRIVENIGARSLIEHLATAYGIPVFLQDLNKASREQTPLVDLGTVSELRSAERVWYDAHGQVMTENGDPGIGRYYISPSVLEADVVISAPKAKVHCSGGITVTMKNMIGIIPSWDGPYEQAQLKDCAHTNDVDRVAGKRGMYLDNDTIWRSMADLNRILLYADAQGQLHAEQQRRYLTIVDGIVAAEASQYNPEPYPLSTVVVGTNPVTVDAVTARCMGFDPRLLKSVTKAAARTEYSLGPAHPSKISVITSGNYGLSAIYRSALTPELYIYSWQGSLEASDFDPPEILEWGWNSGTTELYVRAQDPSRVAWMRIVYVYQGERQVKALNLSEGTATEGIWLVVFPIGDQVRFATLLMGDELFNETSQDITW
jgi:uncharacterized protein (DUF362 family)